MLASSQHLRPWALIYHTKSAVFDCIGFAPGRTDGSPHNIVKGKFRCIPRRGVAYVTTKISRGSKNGQWPSLFGMSPGTMVPTPTTSVRAPTTLSADRVVAVAERSGKAKCVRWISKSRISWGSHSCKRDFVQYWSICKRQKDLTASIKLILHPAEGWGQSLSRIMVCR